MKEIGAVYTIGHSTHSQAYFLELLRRHGIHAVADVRSAPFSKWNQQFNRSELEAVLPVAAIEYRFLGRELGARSDDPSCYRNGKVEYAALAQTEPFQLGLKRISSGIRQGLNIALMCAEKEPLDCHRAILVARQLAILDVGVSHIHADGSIETHSEAEARLLRMYFPEDDLFLSREQMLESAYLHQEENIAYEIDQNSQQRRAAG